jgi:hypothetical protein
VLPKGPPEFSKRADTQNLGYVTAIKLVTWTGLRAFIHRNVSWNGLPGSATISGENIHIWREC